MFQGMNPKLVKQAMKKMGVKEEHIEATEVIIKTQEKELIIKNPQVSKVQMMGQDSFQISGDVEEQELINHEDIQTIIDQTNCSEDEARKALDKAEGDIAQAILSLQDGTD
tara:strand:+ start:1066 stop:1398 length:333 start_codon:yes stop_codon:yes gene_type:complete